MRKIRMMLALSLAVGLSGCGVAELVGRSSDVDSPGVMGLLTSSGHTDMQRVAAHYHVTRVEVSVPHSLIVSESNSFVPIADIVWHGDPYGDRYEQVRAIIASAAERATKGMTKGEAVVVDLEVTRFHALTPKARYTTGGNYATRFLMTVRDAASGQIVDGPRLIVADCPGSGGERAMEEEAAGITQKVVIVSHVALVLNRELQQRLVPRDQVEPGPQVVSRDGFEPAALGLYQ